MYIQWSEKRWAEQHLEGDCRDIGKLKIQFFDSRDGSFLRVHAVESVSDGTLRIRIDPSKENQSG
jgi:hypothetical protein